MERKINFRTNDSLIESSHTATRLDFFGFYMLKARECTAFSASSTKQEINKTKLIYSLGNLERDKEFALQSHADSDRHKAAIEAELLQKNSQFAKGLADKAAQGDKTAFSAFMSAY